MRLRVIHVYGLSGDQQRYTAVDGINIGVNIVQYLSCQAIHIDQGFQTLNTLKKY